jgi:magnesium transporter
VILLLSVKKSSFSAHATVRREATHRRIMAELRLQMASGIVDSEDFSLETIVDAIEGKGLAWLDIKNPDDSVKDFLLNVMQFDELAVEDIFGHADTTAMKFSNHRFVVVNARDADNQLDTEPVAIFLTEDLIITVRHTSIPALMKFRRRFKEAEEEELALGIDFLLYEILDAIADDWQPILGRYSKTLDELEFCVFDPQEQYDNLLEGLHGLKRQLREASKSIESLHTVTLRMQNQKLKLISTGVAIYFSDLNQLCTALVKRANNYSAGATSTRDTYLSNISMELSQSNAQLTEVMTTLTIIGAIMLPLTLIAGIFGMNNEDLPLDQVGGFWGIISMMTIFAVLMLTMFWRRGWLNNFAKK